jgi:hypothetical protein
MLTGEERGLITDMGEKLLDLYAKRDEAVLEGDLDRVHRLQAEIIEVADERQKIVHSVEAR